MRYSADALVAAAGRNLNRCLGWSDEKIQEQLALLHQDPWCLPQCEEEVCFDTGLGRMAVELAMKRHAGTLEVIYTPFGASYIQYGKDLTPLAAVIGTGGVLIHHHNPRRILEGALFDEADPMVLKPQQPTFYLDQEYILAAMGLLREVNPIVALRMMKKYLSRL
jgi:uncharacterized protein (TIGR01319 family)